jgi:hypothetical protein
MDHFFIWSDQQHEWQFPGDLVACHGAPKPVYCSWLIAVVSERQIVYILWMTQSLNRHRLLHNFCFAPDGKAEEALLWLGGTCSWRCLCLFQW